MSRTRSLTSAALAAALTAFHASNGSAEWASSCATVGEGTPGLTIAADWYVPGRLPMTDLAERYLASPGAPITAVEVCTGPASKDTGLSSGYDFYFAPLEDAVAFESESYDAFTWSQSVPVLFAPNAALNAFGGVTDLSEILTGLPETSASRYVLSGTSFSGLALVPEVVVGNPNLASNAYAGSAGQDILLALGYPAWAAPNLPPSPPAWVQAWVDPNAGYRLAAFAFVTSALVSKNTLVSAHAQVPSNPGLAESYYVEFPGYAQENAAVRLTSGAVGDDFWAFLNSGGAYNHFLSTWGYVPPLPFWNSSDIYYNSDQVIYDDKVWEALWWTENEVPGVDVDGPWQEMATTADGTALWTPSRVFHEADLAVFNGELYEAQWWTRDEEPTSSDPWGPWVLVP